MTEAQRWFAQHSAGAPAPLRQRAAGYLAAEPATSGVAEQLAESAAAALDRVLAHPGDRRVALDLLAADALVTLALKARAAEDPAGLAEFAAGLRRARGAPR
ncbi:MAG TPA: hypothetical protein VL241_11355 [Gemmatimonadales bacterium]|nr:hypothetical protein [Gemmatimonadales bacterium]